MNSNSTAIEGQRSVLNANKELKSELWFRTTTERCPLKREERRTEQKPEPYWHVKGAVQIGGGYISGRCTRIQAPLKINEN